MDFSHGRSFVGSFCSLTTGAIAVVAQVPGSTALAVIGLIGSISTPIAVEIIRIRHNDAIKRLEDAIRRRDEEVDRLKDECERTFERLTDVLAGVKPEDAR